MCYYNLLISGKLNDYLADINEQAEELFSRLVKQLSEKAAVKRRRLFFFGKYSRSHKVP